MGPGGERDDRPSRTTSSAGPTLPERGDARQRARRPPANRIEHQAKWVDLQIQQAMARGEFDDLPGQGKPIKDLGSQHDPDWWLKKLIEREKITGVLPPALQLRKEDAELDAKLDALHRGVARYAASSRTSTPACITRPLHPGRRPAAGHPAPRRRRRGRGLAGAPGRAAAPYAARSRTRRSEPATRRRFDLPGERRRREFTG